LRSVVIAEDDPVTRELVEVLLTREGYTVHAAPDGIAGWELLRQHRPTVAVLDVRMPGRSGLELLAAIRAEPGVRRTYVVMLTAENQERDVLAGQAAGADRYLIKPFAARTLIAAVAQGFDLAAARQPEAEAPRQSDSW
jgi:DNA-binding response OmpR family regulator